MTSKNIPPVSLSPNAHEARQTFYQTVLQGQLSNMRSLLSNIEYPDHFIRTMESTSVGLRHFEYLDRVNRKTFVFTVFGEVDKASQITAVGNLYRRSKDGDNPGVISDDSKVRDVLRLRVPSFATPEIQLLFANQFCPLNQSYLDDLEFDKARSIIITKTTECVESTSSMGDPDRVMDILKVTMPKKFGRGDASSKTRISNRTSRITEKKSLASLKTEDAATPSTSSEPAPVDKLPVVEVGGTYDPTLMPDYSPRDFNLQHDLLVQHNIVDTQGKLINAWDHLDKLRPGTIVLARATLHAYNMEGGQGTYKRVYQILADRVRVLYESDYPDSEASDDSESTVDSNSVNRLPEINAANDFDNFVNVTKIAAREKREHAVHAAEPHSPALPFQMTNDFDNFDNKAVNISENNAVSAGPATSAEHETQDVSNTANSARKAAAIRRGKRKAGDEPADI